MPDLVTNRFLFSHHYLERICHEADDRTEAAQLVADLKGWAGGWDDSSLSSLIGSQVGPTLVSLGFNYQEPSDEDDPHLLRLYTGYRQENQVGLCYVAHRQDGETDLDSTIKGRHYAAEIIHALKEKELSWGLLTDGKRWRLYNADVLARYETFLEIDLGQVLKGAASAAKEDAAYFLQTFFTESAFEPDEDGECALDRHLSASEDEASAIEKHLSDCIEDVLRDLCQGFVQCDGQETYTSDERDEVFRNATVLLYRLLFILYAEARDLLPLEDAFYQAVSLDALVEQAAQCVKVTGLPDPHGTQLWKDLSDLCSWINSGDEDHHIPAYNGDLFDDSDKRYIHDHTIADKYLAPALFSLGAIADDSESGYRRIDYRDLSVRHLGSIYEGLLEYKLFIAQERRVRRSDGKGGYTFPKLSETRLKKGEEDQVIDVGEVYFADSAGERKAMGAYYTPEFIVEYIVQQTVRRGLEQRRSSLEEQLPGWLEEVETAPPGERERLQEVVDQKLLDFVEDEVLTFRVCDPAMGSGHFLVNALHTVTTFTVETLNLTPWDNAAMDSDAITWRRRVAKRCLYGVDLNLLAVELAKLSLWLTTVAKGKPLSFLDHHLRHGNSLIGASLEDLIEVLNERTAEEKAKLSTGQVSMLDEFAEFRAPLREATELVKKISARVALAAEDVESQAADYEQVRCRLEPYRDLADLVTARHFGLDLDEGRLQSIAHRLLEHETPSAGDDRALLTRARELARSQDFFHWPFELPEVFVRPVELDATLGAFDVVAGNPPHGAVIADEVHRYIAERFQIHRDSAVDFLELSSQIASNGGLVSFVMPKAMLFAQSWSSAREWLFEEDLQPVIVLDAGREFEGTSHEQSVIVCEKTRRATRGSIFVGYCGAETRGVHVGAALIRRLDMFPCSLTDDGVRVAESVLGSGSSSVFEAWRGLPKRYASSNGELALSHQQVERYYAAEPSQRIDLEECSESSVARLRTQKIVARRLMKRTVIPEPHVIATCVLDREGTLTFETVENIRLATSRDFTSLKALCAVLNSRFVRWWINNLVYIRPQTSMDFDEYYINKIPIPSQLLSAIDQGRASLSSEKKGLIDDWLTAMARDDRSGAEQAAGGEPRPKQDQLGFELALGDVLSGALVFLASQIICFHEKRVELVPKVDLFRYVDRGQSLVRLDEALPIHGAQLVDEMMRLESVCHDIDGLRLVRIKGDDWRLELQAKFRDPGEGWKEHIKEEDGHMIKRRWVPAYRVRMSEEKARFYRYALPRLQDFANASSFPGGYTRSTLKKLHLTKVPMVPDVDLSELARLDRELSKTRRKIELTDDLIDQIVYKLYDLTDEEIAIAEGGA